jgi:AcrR family transcriptional regulator
MDRRQAEVRREEILRATARVVAKKGFARTRVADVAAVLGISSGLVFYHFETKERLLSEAFSAGNADDLATLEATVSGPGSVLDRVRTVMRLYLPTGSAEAWSRDIDAWSEGLYTEEIRQACRVNDERWRARLAALIAEGVASGECSVRDPVEAALQITIMLDGLAVAAQVRGTVDRRTVADWAAEHVARIIDVPVDSMRPTPAEFAEDEAPRVTDDPVSSAEAQEPSGEKSPSAAPGV